MALGNVPESLALGLLQVADIVPFLWFAFSFRLSKSGRFFPNTIWFWLMFSFFCLFAFFSTLFRGANWGVTMIHIGIMFRFVPLSYFIATLDRSEKMARIFTFHFKIISIILLLIGILEVVGGARMISFFTPVMLPKSDVSPILNLSPIKSIPGIFPNTIDYAFFLVISYIFFINQNKPENKLLPRPFLDLLYLFLLFATGSKAALLIALIALFINVSDRKLIKILIVSVIVAASAFLIWLFWDLFYWIIFEDSLHSRLGMFVYTLPYFLKGCFLDAFFGISPNKELVFRVINSLPEVPSMLKDIDAMGAFEDGFYVALIVYYGIVGFGLLVGMYYKLYKTLDNMVVPDNIMNSRFIIRSLFICLIIAPFFAQILITRPFSMFFWIIIGIIYNLYKQHGAFSHI